MLLWKHEWKTRKLGKYRMEKYSWNLHLTPWSLNFSMWQDLSFHAKSGGYRGGWGAVCFCLLNINDIIWHLHIISSYIIWCINDIIHYTAERATLRTIESEGTHTFSTPKSFLQLVRKWCLSPLSSWNLPRLDASRKIRYVVSWPIIVQCIFKATTSPRSQLSVYPISYSNFY